MASDDLLIKNRGLGMLLSSLGVNKGQNVSSSGVASQGPAGNSRTEQDNQSGQGKSGNTSAEGHNKTTEEVKFTKEFQDEDVYGPKSLNTWADIKEYDDELDNEWFDFENDKLAEKYGGKFIFAKYLDSQPGRVGYFCQLCCAEMNAKKSLKLHCSGMKHLKKKDQWEKGGKKDTEEGSDNYHKRDSHKPPQRPPPRTWSDRERPRREPYIVRRPHLEQRSYSEQSSNYRYDDRRDGYGYPDNYYNDYYRNEPGQYRRPYDRALYDNRLDQPDLRKELDRRHPPPRRGHEDRYPRDRFSPYTRREAPPPPVISSTPEIRNATTSHADSTAMLFEGIADGSCGELLKKLSVCRVKSKEDTALASNVAGYLVASLKEYYHKTGPPTIVHVLDEIILKINIMKDLQK